MNPLAIKLYVGSDKFDLTKADPEKIKAVIDRVFELNISVVKLTDTLDDAIKAAKELPPKQKGWEDEDEDESDDLEEDEDED